MWPAGVALHAHEGLQTDDAYRHVRRNLLDHRGGIFGIEVERLAGENVDRRVAVLVTVKRQHGHSLVRSQASTVLGAGKLAGRDRHDRPVAQARQGRERRDNPAGLETHDQVDVLGVPAIAVRDDRQAIDHDEGHLGIIEGANDALHRLQSHSSSPAVGRAPAVARAPARRHLCMEPTTCGTTPRGCRGFATNEARPWVTYHS